jgi:hypothetical protein
MERPCLPQQLHQLKRCVRSGLCAINVDWPGIAGTLFAAMRQVWLVRYIRIGMTDSCHLTQQLIHPKSCKLEKEDNLSLASLIRACSREERMQTVTDFRHMILLISTAFHIQKCICSIMLPQSGFVLSTGLSEFTSESKD